MTVFQRRNNVSLSALNERHNLTSKQRWFWFDTKIIFVLWHQQTQHVEPMSKLCRHVNIGELSRHFDVIFWCNFDDRIINVISLYIFDIVSMDGKLTQLQRASFDVLLKDKNRGYLSAPYW